MARVLFELFGMAEGFVDVVGGEPRETGNKKKAGTGGTSQFCSARFLRD
jgi:hypothetical protein